MSTHIVPGIGDNAAGVMGPRGCAPLLQRGRGRIGAAMFDFQIPTVTSFIALSTSSPVKVAGADPYRAIIGFGSTNAIGGGTAVLLAPNRDALARTPAAWTLAVGHLAAQPAILPWTSYGALVTGEWWALALAANQNLFVTEMQYMD